MRPHVSIRRVIGAIGVARIGAISPAVVWRLAELGRLVFAGAPAESSPTRRGGGG